jgi:hypothetical protein
MNKKTKEQLKSFLIICLGLVVLTGIAVAADYGKPINVAGDYNYYASGDEFSGDEGMLGGGGPSLRVAWDFREGIEVDGTEVINTSGQYTGGILTDLAATFTGDISSNDDFSSTGTTTIPWLDASSVTALSWTGGTTTGETTLTVVASVINDGADLLCTDTWVDLSTTRGVFSGNITVGTTTATGDVSYTNTSTDSLIASTEITTSSVDILNRIDEEGGHSVNTIL